MNGFRYLIVGMDYDNGQKLGEENCGWPICPMAIPANPTEERQEQYAKYGFDNIKTDSAKWQPGALGGMEFPSDELARLWLDSTDDGKNFKQFFKYIFIARVRG